MSLEMLNL